MKINSPNLPNVLLPKSDTAPSSTALDEMSQAARNFQQTAELDKYKEFENAPVIAYEDPFKGRNASLQQYSRFVGMRHYRIQSSAIEMGNPNKERTYQYGDLTETDDINAFLDQLERLSGDQKLMFEHVKPTKELLELATKLTDEELGQLAEFMVEVSQYDFLQNKSSKLAERLIPALNDLSADALSSSIGAMKSLLENGQSYKKNPPPVGLDDRGLENVLFTASEDGMDFKAGYLAANADTELSKRYAELLITGKMSDEQTVQFNTHLSQSSFEQTRGMVDMASLIKTHQIDDMLAMFNDVDKDAEQDLFAYLGEQVNYQAHRQYYQTESGDYVAQQDDIASESDRRSLYKNVLKAYNEFGVGWINDALKEMEGSPAQIQKELWSKLLADKDEMPEQFSKSDALEQWAVNNVDNAESKFHFNQVMKIHEFNQTRYFPERLGTLTFYASGNLLIVEGSTSKENSNL